jgi:hypothetical protein
MVLDVKFHSKRPWAQNVLTPQRLDSGVRYN